MIEPAKKDAPPMPFCWCAIGRARWWGVSNPPPEGKINTLPLLGHFACNSTGYIYGTNEHAEEMKARKR